MINWIIVEEQRLDLELSNLEDYFTSLEQFMHEEELRIKEKFSELKAVKLENEDYAQVLEDLYIEDYQSFNERYPNKLRLALLLETYTVLEKYLTKVCILLRESLLLNKKLPKRPDLINLDAYLKKNCTVSFEEFIPEWGFINNIRLIRNVIAHGHGSFEVGDESQSEKKKEEITKIIAFILNYPDITIMEKEADLKKTKEGIYNIYLPSMELNIEFIKKIRSFASKISNTTFRAKDDKC